MKFRCLPPLRSAPLWSSAAPLCFLFATGAAAGGGPLGLGETMRAATANAPRLAAQAARLTAAQEDAARAGRLPDPMLAVGVDNLTVTGAEAFRLGGDDMTMRRIGFSQGWPTRRARDAARAFATAQADVLAGESIFIQRQVEREAGEAWIETWVAEKELAFVRTQRDDAERAARIAAAQFASGGTSAASALAAEAVTAEIEADLLAAEAEVTAARAGLARWLGADRARATLDAAPDFDALATAPARLLSVLDSHAELAAWEARERAALAAVGAARARKRPELGFGASYGARSGGLPDMAMFEVTVGLPLFAKNRQDRDIAARSAEAEAVRAEREEAERQHRESMERLLARWSGLRAERARLVERALPLARDRRELALAAFAGGDAIQPWLDARRDELALLRRIVQTEGALGRAWVQIDTLSVPGAETGVTK